MPQFLEDILTALGAWVAGFFTGKETQRRKQAERRAEDAKTGNAIQDRVALDRKYRDRVRDKYR